MSKFKKPSEKALKDNAAAVGGIVLGAMTSKGVMSLVHAPSGAMDEATMKKEKNMLLLKRGVMIAVGFAGASAIQGTDTVTTIIKGVLQGVAAGQALEVAKDFAASSSAIKTGSAAVTKSEKLIAASFGLACPCNGENVGMGGARNRRRKPNRGMGLVLDGNGFVPRMELVSDNAFQDAVNAGRVA